MVGGGRRKISFMGNHWHTVRPNLGIRHSSRALDWYLDLQRRWAARAGRLKMRMTRPTRCLPAATRCAGVERPLAAGSAQTDRPDACAAKRECRRAERDCCCPQWPKAGAAAAEGPPCLQRDLISDAGAASRRLDSTAQCCRLSVSRPTFQISATEIAPLFDPLNTLNAIVSIDRFTHVCCCR